MMNYRQFWFVNLWGLRHTEQIQVILQKEFCVSLATFEYIVNLVQASMARRDTNVYNAIVLHKRVAIAM